MVDLLAYRHHMRWLKLCEDTLASDRKSRTTDFSDHLRDFDVSGWKKKIGVGWKKESHRIINLNPCRFCKVCVKTPLSPMRSTGMEPIIWHGIRWPVHGKYRIHAV